MPAAIPPCRDSGFSLIEPLVAIAMLAGMPLPAVGLDSACADATSPPATTPPAW